MKVGIYARVSDERDQSVPWQLAECRRRAAEEGWEVVAEYEEDPTSAFDRRKRRPCYEDLVRAVEEGRIEAPLSTDTERLLRQDREGQRWLDLYEAGKVRRLLFTDQADIYLTRADDRTRFKKQVADAVGYSERLSEKIRRTKRGQAANGEWGGGGRRPFGYRKVPDLDRPPRRDGTPRYKLAIDDGEAQVLRRAARAVIRGASLHSIVREWNDRSQPVRKDSGSRWTISDVRRVLLSPLVAGIREYGPRDKDGKRTVEAEYDATGWEPILDRETHGLLKARLSDPERKRVERTGRQARRWAGAGVLRCAECRTPLYGQAQVRILASGSERLRRSYVCSSANGGCGGIGITAPSLERHLISLAVENVQEPEPQEATAVSEDEAEVLRELRDLEDRKRRLGEDYAEGLLTGVQVKTATDRLDARIAELQPRLGAVEAAPPPEDWAALADQLEAMQAFNEGTLDELPPDVISDVNGLLRYAFERVDVSPASVRGERFNPDRLQIRWRDGVRPLGATQA